MKKGIISIMSANVICMLLGIMTNFLLPKYLSVDSYGMLKTYSLYLSYAGFFSIGYSDGMYLRYGGKTINEIDKEDLSNNFFNYILLIIIGSVLVFIASILLKDDILTAFAIGLFSYNIMGYLKMLYQAIGEFSLYTKALNIEKFAVFAMNIVLLFVLQFDHYRWYVWAQVLAGVTVTIYFSFRLQIKIPFLNIGKVDGHEVKENIKNGYVLMLGNFSSGIFTGLDRWFIKFLMDNICFAMYSFAVSFESVINVFLSPITVSMYNYFCKNPDKQEIIFAKKLTLLWGLVIAGGTFPAKFFIKYYLTQYADSSAIIVFLLAAQVFYVLVKGIYVNTYKANKEQNRYFKQLIMMIIVGFSLNAISYFLFRNMLCIAAATFLTAVIWYIVCEIGYQGIHFSSKDFCMIIVMITIYFICGLWMDSVIGCIIYYTILVISSFIFMNDCVKYLVSEGILLFHKIQKNNIHH